MLKINLSNLAVKIVLRTPTGKVVGEFSFWGFFIVLIALYGIFLALLEPELLLSIIKKNVGNLPSNPSEFRILHVAGLILGFLTVFSFVKGMGKMWDAACSMTKHVYENLGPWTGVLIRNKIFQELNNSDFSSAGAFDDEIKSAREDEDILIKSVPSIAGAPNNRIKAADWPDLDHKLLSDISSDLVIPENSFEDNRNALLEEIKEVETSINKKNIVVKFIVASVQPSVVLVVKEIIDKMQLNKLIDLRVNVSTGPETVDRAIMQAKNRDLSGHEDSFVIFAAPLSAFLTKKCDNENDDPRKYFYPICSLLKEEQRLFIVENGSKTPLVLNKMYYYDNSTAEEYVARMKEGFHGFMEKAPIYSYLEYKNLLYGKDDRMKAGDGVVVWEPLTKHFLERDIKNGFYNKNGLAEKWNSSKSRIMLFSDKRVLSSNTSDARFAQLFLKLLIFEMRRWKNLYCGRHKQIFRYWASREIIRDYEEQFNKLVLLE